MLVDSYSSLFPIRVRVVKGYYGERGESSAIATDELYNFHFVKRAKVRVGGVRVRGSWRYRIQNGGMITT